MLSLIGACGDTQAPGASQSGSGGSAASAGVAGSATGGVAGTTAAGGTGTTQGGVSAGVASLGGASGASGASGAAGSGGASAVAGAAGAMCQASTALSAWPGKNEVKTLDQKAQFASDLSGLTYEAGTQGAPGVLWAVNNLSGTLFRLLPSAGSYLPDTANGWAAGKQLRYPNGMGSPDAEGVTFGKSVADGVYVCAEHDADDSSTSRLSVLRYDVSAAGAGATLTATHEWNLTALLPKVGANTGLEAITWVPDFYLIGKAFRDDAKQQRYMPLDYPDHGDGLFFVGVEETGKIHVVALNHQDSSAVLIATISTPNSGVMGLEFDREAGNLWFNCDDTCGNKSGVLDIDGKAGSATLGQFVLRYQFARPSSLPDSNNEGIAVAPQSECQDGYKSFFWTDDADQDGFSLRTDKIRCGGCF